MNFFEIFHSVFHERLKSFGLCRFYCMGLTQGLTATVLEEKIDTIVVIIILPDFTANYYLDISYPHTVFRSLAVFLKGVIEESTSGKGWCHWFFGPWMCQLIKIPLGTSKYKESLVFSRISNLNVRAWSWAKPISTVIWAPIRTWSDWTSLTLRDDFWFGEKITH